MAFYPSITSQDLAARRESLEKRFWPKVWPEPMSGCWLWSGAVRGPNPKQQYGHMWAGDYNPRTNIGAHRVSWFLHNGDVPDGMVVLHKCDNSLCVNPDHLRLGTQSENIRDMDAKGRRRSNQRRRRGNALLSDEALAHVHRREISARDYAAMYEVSLGTIYYAMNKRA